MNGPDSTNLRQKKLISNRDDSWIEYVTSSARQEHAAL